MNALGAVLGQIESWVISMTGELWVYPLTWLLTAVDGFFPPVPGESVVTMLAVTWRTSGSPTLLGVVLAAAAGAWCGDQVAFLIGRRIGTDRVRFLRAERGRATVAWARRALSTHGPSFIIAARYIPIGRLAVNMTAGAVGYSHARFMRFSAVGAALWSAYAVAMGVLAGAWLYGHPLLAMAVGVAAGIGAGVLIERVVRLLMTLRKADVGAARHDAPAARLRQVP